MMPTILAGSANEPLAAAVAARLRTRMLARTIDRFPDAELHVTLRETVRDQDVYIIQPTSPPSDEHLIELLFLADACRRGGAGRVTAVMPYFAYARQDRRGDGDVPIGARVVADLIESVGISRIIAVDLHAPELEGFFRIPLEHVSAAHVLSAAVRASVTSESVLVAPDVGAARLAENYQRLLSCPMVVVRKSRLERQGASLRGIVGEDLDGKSPILVDDMIATGATIQAAVTGLIAAGCHAGMSVLATHGLFVDDAIERLRALPIRQIIVTNSIDRRSPLLFPTRTVDLAPLLAATIARVHGMQPAAARSAMRA